MIAWKSLSSLFRAQSQRGAQARLELADAYRWLAQQERGKIIIADLAAFAGFFEVTEAFAPPEIRAFNDGKRAAFGRLFHFVNLNDEDRASLAAAARLETRTDAAQGHIDP